MVENDSNNRELIEDGVVQLRFADENGAVQDLIAAEVIEVLQGLVEFTSDMAKRGLFGDGHEPEVRVRPAKEGSFILEAVIAWVAENPEAAVGTFITASAAVTQAINVGFKKIRGQEPSNFEHLDNGNVKVQWPGNKVNEVPRPVWDRLNAMKRPTRSALRKLLTPLGDEAQTLEVRDGALGDSTATVLATEPDAVATRADYREVAAEHDDVEESTRTFETEARLQSIDFRPGEKWRVETIAGNRLATMEDDEFMLDLDRGAAIHKDDIFVLEIRENRTTKNERTTTEWAVSRVIRRRRGGDNGSLPPRR